MRTRAASVIVVLVLAASACSSSGDPDPAAGVDLDAAASAMVQRFGITEEQARCGLDLLDERVIQAFVEADFDLSQMDEGDAADVYDAGLECVGDPGG